MNNLELDYDNGKTGQNWMETYYLRKDKTAELLKGAQCQYTKDWSEQELQSMIGSYAASSMSMETIENIIQDNINFDNKEREALLKDRRPGSALEKPSNRPRPGVK